MQQSDLQEIKEKINFLQQELISLKSLLHGNRIKSAEWKEERVKLEERLLAMVNQNAFLVQKIDELEVLLQEREKNLSECQHIIEKLEEKMRFFPVRVVLKIRKFLLSDNS